MAISELQPSSGVEELPRGDLRKMMKQQPMPIIDLGDLSPSSISNDEASGIARSALARFSTALVSNDKEALISCFFDEQAYWRDHLALTYHLRTFHGAEVISDALLETKELRNVMGSFNLVGQAHYIKPMPVLQFIDCGFEFRTESPSASCNGTLKLFPVKSQVNGGPETLEWKIWIINTMLESLDVLPETPQLLAKEARDIAGLETIKTDVLIIGGGNSGCAVAARLKALRIDCIMVERNPNIGDSWAFRYDTMAFHVPTASAMMPFVDYKDEWQHQHLLRRLELSSFLREYVANLKLNAITSAKILRTTRDLETGLWHVKLDTPNGMRTIISKHLVQATGLGSQKPFVPPIKDSGLFKGISAHSIEFKSGKALCELGARSVIVVGGGNSAFDILKDCVDAGLRSTIATRSPPWIVPYSYIGDPSLLGVYQSIGVSAADRMLMLDPNVVGSHLIGLIIGHLASQEPDRYSALTAKGFPFVKCDNPDTGLLHYLLERAGGHVVDVGGPDLVGEGKAGFKVGAEPVAYTSTGLQFSDGSTLDADAIVWATGFADKDARTMTKDILQINEDLPVDGTWGLDAEGEIRGVWKRQSHVENFWIMAGHTQFHRWYSRVLALQIQADLEGVLPPAYRKTPQPTR